MTSMPADKEGEGLINMGTKVIFRRPRLLSRLGEERSGQGTTEYAILVGVLVVIAILAILSFKGKVSELWTTISDGINQL